MEYTRRSRPVYVLLFAAWGLVVGWQVAEHLRVRQSERAALIARAKDISNTLGVVLRSQRRFGGVIKDRIESALNSLVNPGELNGISLLNDAGDEVASAGTPVGTPVDPDAKNFISGGGHWDEQTVTVMNLVELGTNLTSEMESQNPTIILPRNEMFSSFGTNRSGTNRIFSATNNLPFANQYQAGPPPDRDRPPPPDFNPAANNEPPPRPPRQRRGDGRQARPPGMSEEDYKTFLLKQGVHSFALVLSTRPMHAALRQDLWMRGIICILATISVIGSGLAWRNLAKSSDLQFRLVRASEMNSHLKEMNLAAAGLAHETRNPLNIIRGLAQMIFKEQDAPTEIKKKTRDIIDETDRVTAQLNEFINYSRPREVRRAALALNSVINEVVHALNYDIEEKKIHLQVKGDALTIQADEQLLRQALFNLVLNAIQAADAGGEIEIVSEKQDSSGAILEIRDNGPGVPADRLTQIFKPYFTTTQNGTGLGLAVVQQIVLAHGWEIQCLANEPKGAIFRITHLRIAA